MHQATVNPVAPFDALVAAGGFGTRMGLGRPKSGLYVDDEMLLDRVVGSIQALAPRKLLICCGESREWRQRIAGRYHGQVEVVASTSDVPSLRLLQEYLPILGDRVLFAYGHAPRPRHHLEALATCDASFAVSTVSMSTRRDLVRTVMGRFIEPPFILRTELVSRFLSTWSAMLRQHHFEEFPMSGPGEFNSHAEFIAYASYLRDLEAPNP